MMCVASMSVVLPSFSTLTRPGPAQRPQPCIQSTLFLRKRNSIPLACRLTTFSLRASAAAQFSENSFTSMPNSFGILERVVNFSRVQQNLCRDAADVQASAAQETVLLNASGFQSPLRGANRGVVSPGTAADNRKIVFGQVSSAAGVLPLLRIRSGVGFTLALNSSREA